ncbi:ABC transporter ATP-binding protein [Desulfopila inferna]|uniref:ABC transporter ATP-binding protein n=1 Tax=Desulfopila inferna TaxID=468528 RepID=UPI00196238AD|nr:ABC transporter ATP-binding protein [Desulfopila inferna]MBM9604451.1 ABC transporter ATP-binding protein [Desulfopila inferna]
MIALDLQNNSLSYGGNKVVDDVSFSAEAGEFFMILGPNGAGKSSLLKLIAGIEKSQFGQINILGRPKSTYSTRDLAKVIALVAQQAPIDFPFSVAETVLMGRSPHLGLLGIEAESDYALAREAMCFTGIEQFANRRLDQLSGGERQRVMIARAICQEPRIILLDEPTTALDPAHQLRIMDLMERFRQEKKTTVIMVSHDLNLAALYSDRLLLMKNGRVVVIGTPSEVFIPEYMEKSYECDLLIDENPVGNVPRVMPVPEKFKNDKSVNR